MPVKQIDVPVANLYHPVTCRFSGREKALPAAYRHHILAKRVLGIFAADLSRIEGILTREGACQRVEPDRLSARSGRFAPTARNLKLESYFTRGRISKIYPIGCIFDTVCRKGTRLGIKTNKAIIFAPKRV